MTVSLLRRERGLATGLEWLEHGAAPGVTRAVEAALDPLGILSPGMVLPE